MTPLALCTRAHCAWQRWRRGGLALGFALLALVLRYGAGYPLCQNDEKNWAYIAQQLERGVDWPVSGPLFIQLVGVLAQHGGVSHSTALAWAGVSGTFIAVYALLWGFARIGVASPTMCLLALMLSSYFWAPLLESRPQQWGQVIVFIAAVCAWRWLRRQGGWMFFALLPLAAFTHILSHSILIALCTTLTMADWAEARPFTRRHVVVLVSLLCSAAVYIWPGGPYARMLEDVQQNHLPHLLALGPWLATALATVALALAATQQRWYWRPGWSRRVAAVLEHHRLAVWLGLALVLAAALALQARLLPEAAWGPYRGSAWRFVLFQGGNLLFAAVFVKGIFELMHKLQAAAAPAMARFLIWALLAFGLLEVVAIGASGWMLDTNWFLRILNYVLPFCVPIAALGIAGVVQRLRRCWVADAAFALAIAVSLASVLRPPVVLGC